MKVLIIGGVAAGTKTAAKLKRTSPEAEVSILTKDSEISYAGCGLPYFIGGVIKNESELIVNSPAQFSALTGVAVETGCEAISLDAAAKQIAVKSVTTGRIEYRSYDKIVLAVGASPIVPILEGSTLEGIFSLRTPADASNIRHYLEAHAVSRAVVVGGGFIGLEVAENLKARGVSVTVIDLAKQLLPNIFDPEMADYIKRHLEKNEIRVLTGTKAEKFIGEGTVSSVRTDNGSLPAELVILSIGIRPNTDFLKDSGLLLSKGAIIVDDQMKTNLPDVYAAGDCVVVTNRITGQAHYSPMGSSANFEGRTLAQILAGRDKHYPGVLGTGIVRLPSLNCGRTGLTEAQAKAAGFDIITALSPIDDKPHYYPDFSVLFIKLTADRKSHRLLGAQVLGSGAVDKLIDLAALGISMGVKLEDFDSLDLAYAPPFSTAIHPLVQAVYILINKLDGNMVSITPAEYAAGLADNWRLIDVSRAPAIRNATYVSLDHINGPIDGIGLNEKLLLVCNRGRRAYLLQNKMRHYGYTDTFVLEGATLFNELRY